MACVDDCSLISRGVICCAPPFWLLATKATLQSALAVVPDVGMMILSWRDEFSLGMCKIDVCNYDVTMQLQHSERHCLGLLLGNSMYHVKDTTHYKKISGSFGPLKAIAHLELQYVIGPTEVVDTDAQWRINPGLITYLHIFGWEDYDVRLEAKGWDSPQFNDATTWDTAVLLDGLCKKAMNDKADTQGEDGMLPTTAPEYPIFDSAFRNSPEWILCTQGSSCEDGLEFDSKI